MAEWSCLYFCSLTPLELKELQEKLTDYFMTCGLWGVFSMNCVSLSQRFQKKRSYDSSKKSWMGPTPQSLNTSLLICGFLWGDLLQKNPADRPSACDILERRFIQGMLSQKLRRIPEELLQRLDKLQQTEKDLQQKLNELNKVADQLEHFHFSTTFGSLTGGVASATGGVVTFVGLALAPFTGGASLLLGVGIGVGIAGGLFGAASNVAKIVNESVDRSKIDNIIQDLQSKMQDVVACSHHMENSLEDLKQTRSLSAGVSPIRGVVGCAVGCAVEEMADDVLRLAVAGKMMKTGGRAARAAKSARLQNVVKIGRLAQSISGALSGLFLAVDIYFIVDDYRELQAIKQGGSNTGPEASSADSNKALKTREFIKKIRQVSKELQKWLNEVQTINADIRREVTSELTSAVSA